MKRIRYGAVCLTTILFLLPLFFVLEKSFYGNAYKELIRNHYPYFHFFSNSLIYGFCSAAPAVLLAIPPAYLFAKIRFRFRELLFFLYILVLLMPFQTMELSEYIVLRDLSFLNTRFAIFLPQWFSPLPVFLLRQCFRSLPDEVVDAFRMESGSPWIFLIKIAVPFAAPTLITLGIIVFCDSYNIVEQALIFLPQSESLLPLSSVISELPADVRYAGDVLYLLPAFFLYRIFSDEIFSGMEFYQWN